MNEPTRYQAYELVDFDGRVILNAPAPGLTVVLASDFDAALQQAQGDYDRQLQEFKDNHHNPIVTQLNTELAQAQGELVEAKDHIKELEDHCKTLYARTPAGLSDDSLEQPSPLKVVESIASDNTGQALMPDYTKPQDLNEYIRQLENERDQALADREAIVELVMALPKLEWKVWVCREKADDMWFSVCYGIEGDYEVFAAKLMKNEADAIGALLNKRKELP